MSFINDDLAKFKDLMQDLSKLGNNESNSSTKKPPSSISLSKKDIKAFEGLCAMEGTLVKDKIAELIKDYVEQKQKQMGI
ncbi:MAG TPA: hypothetical protein ACFCUY_04360 [Xenococcaceae cyanobacterium]